MALWKIKENWRNVPGVERSLGITGCGGWSNGMVVRSRRQRSKLVQRINKEAKECPGIDGLYVVVVDGPTEE
jgi:hypothetical protein